MFYGLGCEERMLQNQSSERPTVDRKYNWHPKHSKFQKQRSTVNADHAKSLVPPDLKITTPFTNSLLERLSDDSYSSEEWKIQNLFIVTHCPVGKSSLMGPSGHRALTVNPTAGHCQHYTPDLCERKPYVKVSFCSKILKRLPLFTNFGILTR